MNLLLVDDHPLFGVGLAHALTTAAPDVQVLTATSLAHGLEIAAERANLDIVLIDYHLGAHNGIEGLRRFGQQFPLVARVLISGDETPTLLAAARAAGASGFVGKSLPLDRMLAALRAVADGELAFGSIPCFELPPVSTAAAPQPTLRQMEVLAMVAHGQPNKRIAATLGIAERTVKLHMTALLVLLGARNRTHLLVVARERGLL
jgi:DNA-binding NarL/FixJ family response regulator